MIYSQGNDKFVNNELTYTKRKKQKTFIFLKKCIDKPKPL